MITSDDINLMEAYVSLLGLSVACGDIERTDELLASAEAELPVDLFAELNDRLA